MISLDLTRRVPVDTTKLYLLKGRRVSLCHHCHKSMSRHALLRCDECHHDFCPDCLDACRCYTLPALRGGVLVPRRKKQAVASGLAVVSSGVITNSRK